GQFDAPEGVTVASDGRIYVADTNNHRVQVFNSDGEFLDQWGSFCDLASGEGCNDADGQGQFNAPEGIAFAPATDTVYVADSGNNRIQGFAPNGEFRFAWGESGSESGQFNLPVGVAVDGAGRVFVADVLNHRVQVFDPVGTFLREWGSEGQETGQFKFPADVAFHDRRVYVTDNGNHRVQVFSAEGEFEASFGTHCDLESGDGCNTAEGKGQFDMPFGIAIGNNGTVYVLDQGNNRVQAFNADGEFQGKWGSQCALYGLESEDIPEGEGCDTDNGQGEFLFPKGIAVAPDGTVVVVDSDNHRVQLFEPR
ncbi:MAG: SMP-30/gluconolactonase/LRE family protein, partial [Candidatus Bipolaricaulia bacterium]